MIQQQLDREEGTEETEGAFRNGDLLASDIAERAWKESHQVDWEAPEILDVCRSQMHAGVVAHPPRGRPH